MARMTAGDQTTRSATAAAAARRGLALLALALCALCALAPAALARTAGPDGGAKPAIAPPKITKQPSSVAVAEGASASFECIATGASTTQWQISTNGGTSWAPIEGATSSTYTIASTTMAENGDEFRVVFTNAGGETISKAATLTVEKAPAITKQPNNALVVEGHAATFEAAASGSPTPTVQWQSSLNGGLTWKNVSGATNTTLTVNNVKAAESNTEYRAIFKNVLGEATTNAATLTVAAAPSITKQPSSITVTEGEYAVFEATASGSPNPEVQWEVSTNSGATWSPIPEANYDQYAVSSTKGSEDGNEYRATFTNIAGSTATAAATLTVQAVPVVTLQPQSTTILAGANATFEAAGKGTPTPTVQWEVSTNSGTSWSAVSGATADQLSISAAPLSDNGYEYRAAFANRVGTAYSSAATLTVSATDYSAYGWGMNNRGEVGTGSNLNAVKQPMPITALHFVTAMAGGERHSLALLANGTVYAWGFNGHGQIGDEGATNVRTPLLVENLQDVKAIAAGGNHSLALLANGTVMAWGDDEHGQLGNGKTTDSEVPVPVKNLTNAVAIAAGEEDSMALLENGTVMTWGDDSAGELGTGGAQSLSDVPVEVRGLSGVKAIAAGGSFDLALLENGTVVAWGDDGHDQLGNQGVLETGFESESEEEGVISPSPVPVEGLTGVKAIAAGSTHALALLDGGTVMAWGDDGEGELGNGAIEDKNDTPAPVTGLSHVTQISAGNQDSIALLESGNLAAWGSNTFGQLGDDAEGAPSDVPVTVQNVSGAFGVAAGGFHMLAFGEALPAVTGLSPQAGPTAGGTTVTITGTNLGQASAVRFGSTPARSFTVDSPTSITAVSPGGTGTVNVVVSTSSGETPEVPADQFTYRVPPTVTKLSAKGGPASGGTTVTILGTEFTGATKVEFGGVPASEFKVNAATSITAVAPANVSGTVYVTVTAVGGTSATSSKGKFKYTPTIASISPGSGPHAGGTTVEVTGAGFALGSATKFKFGRATVKSVDCTSATTCILTTPVVSAAGTVVVKATADKASSVAAPGDEFTYE